MDIESEWKKFSESPLNDWLKKHLHALGIETPSPIQTSIINAVIDQSGQRKRRNIFACSPTGTGKTLAYVLPILHFLNQDIQPYYALILAPTRELAYQIHEIVKVLAGEKAKSASSTMIKTLLLIGGGSSKSKRLKSTRESDMQGFWLSKPNIVVATPGSLAEQFTRRNFSDHTGHKSALKFNFLVLDEADLLVSSTFSDQLAEVLDTIDEHTALCKEALPRQTIVLSATLTSELEALKKTFESNDEEDLKPIFINHLPVVDENIKRVAQNPHLDQRYLLCPEDMKPVYLIQCLSDISFKQVIIFCSSTRKAAVLHRLMINLGFADEDLKCNPVLLVGDKDQYERLKSLEEFKSLKSRIMIATSGLVSRGLDLPQVDLVIIYNCPKNPVDYVHQVGRTCRKIDFSSDKTSKKYHGKSILLVTQYDIAHIKKIESFIEVRLSAEESLQANNITDNLKPVAIALKDAELSVIEEAKARLEAKQI